MTFEFFADFAEMGSGFLFFVIDRSFLVVDKYLGQRHDLWYGRTNRQGTKFSLREN